MCFISYLLVLSMDTFNFQTLNEGMKSVIYGTTENKELLEKEKRVVVGGLNEWI